MSCGWRGEPACGVHPGRRAVRRWAGVRPQCATGRDGGAGCRRRAQPGAAAGAWRSSTRPESFLRKGPVLPLTPAEEAAHLLLPPGFTMTPVLSEPDVQEPAQIAFDGNGRMFVLEIRGYMQDKDATGELLPVGRISRHEDRDNDGVYETHTVFVDKLVFPRFVMPLGADAVLTKESNADEVWKFTDTNQDGVADRKDLFTTGFGRVLNVEHQESGLTWAMDNWMYSTINQVRLRLAPDGGVIKEPTGANSSQWGVTQDNYGKVWFQGGASGMPGYFQFPVVYGFFRHPEQFEPNLDVLWGAPVLIGDMQGGPGAIRMPDGSLTRGTGAAGNDIFRGHRLPKDLLGDYFYGEAVGRIVRRLRPVKTEGLTQLRNVLSAVGVHPIDRSALPARRHDDGAGRHDVHHRHVPRDHSGVAVVGSWKLPAPADRAVRARQDRAPRPRLAAALRRHRARPHAAPHAQ